MTRIEYNSENKNDIINSLNNCMVILSDVDNIFHNIDIPYEFKHKVIVNNLKNDVKKSKENISDYKNNINKYMEEINKNELEILSKINKIQDNIIERLLIHK